jgi:hypothetical protein
MLEMKAKYGHFISAGIVLLSLGCKKFVEIPPPETELVTASVFNSNATATSAQTNIYATMVTKSESANMAIYLGLLSDELTNYERAMFYIQYYHNAMAAAANPGPWNDAYNYIYQVNAVIAALEGNSALSPAVQRQLLGESKFLRSFWLFYLTNLYGDIPLVTSTSYTVNAQIAPTSRSKIYQQIIADLIEAKGLMNSNYIDASDTTITTADRTRPNKWAAAALLARTYLFTGDYLDAEMESDSVINASSLYSLVSDLNDVFLVNSPEAIWQLDIPLPTNTNTPDALDFILVSTPSVCSISPQLLASFEPGDQRRLNWVDSFRTSRPPIVSYYFPYKYKIRYSTTVTEDVMVLRLAEQYLIRAEAEANLGDMTDAAIDLNMVRTRAGLGASPTLTASSDLAQADSAILHERQVELFTEWGHRWLDLIRTKSVDSVMSVVTPMKGGLWSADDHQLLFPIPQAERNLDINLAQNPGY